MKRIAKKRLLSFFICLALFAGQLSISAIAAPVWPDGPSISAEGGILMDGNSGAILYAKNIHEQYFPASITKILTALIILENCSMDEVVTFSHNAVYNVETNSSNANLEEGDRLTVLDCLYAMMLKSANEAANALAEHVAGSTEAFSAIMNARAISLGCTDSHFNNPSGLNDPDHYTSAYDMALIAQAAFQNETFAQIASTLYYDLPPTKRNPDGLRIYPGHQMIKKNSPNYYAGAVGGKTGYTTLAGNTLVTCAKRGNMQLITVVLNGHRTHYIDTRAMLNFGFRNFRSLEIAEFDTTYTSVDNDLTIAGLPVTDLSVIRVQENRRVTLPVNAEFSDTSSTISYELPPEAPEHSAAQILYDYEGHTVGFAYLLVGRQEQQTESPMAEVAAGEGETMAEAGSGEETGVPGESGSGGDGVEVLPGERRDTDAWEILPGEIGGGDAGEVLPKESGGAESPGNGRGTFSLGKSKEIASGERIFRGEKDSGRKGFWSFIHVPVFVWILLAGVLAAAAGYGVLYGMRSRRKRESADRMLRHKRRQQRLQDIGVSADEFMLLLEQRKRQGNTPGRPKRRQPKKRKKR